MLAGSISLSLVACGGGDKKPEEKPETGALKGSITVQAEEFAFDAEAMHYFDGETKQRI